MTKSTEHSYGRYTIRAFATGPKVQARAFLGAKPVTYAEGASIEKALHALRSSLDKRDAEQRDTRKDGIPTAQEFADAFTRLDGNIGKHHWLMLKALLAAPERTLTATEIAAAAGYSSFSSANAHLGKLARMIAEDLDYTPSMQDDGTRLWTMTLATGPGEKGSETDRYWRWTLRAEVAEALRELNVG